MKISDALKRLDEISDGAQGREFTDAETAECDSLVDLIEGAQG